MEKSYSESYAAAGVDITAGYRSVELMKQYVARTMNEHCIGGLGGFGGLFELDCTGYKHPVLISGTDGVGTKLKSRWYFWTTSPAAATCRKRSPTSSRAWPRAACRPIALWWAARLPSTRA